MTENTMDNGQSIGIQPPLEPAEEPGELVKLTRRDIRLLRAALNEAADWRQESAQGSAAGPPRTADLRQVKKYSAMDHKLASLLGQRDTTSPKP